jgi:hypothetical protein
MFPDEVIAELAVKNAGGVIPTDVTVPAPVTEPHLTPLVCVESAIRICPSVPTGTRMFVVPELAMMSPFVVVGARALNAASFALCPVPPAEIGIDPVSFVAARDVIHAGSA